MRTRQFLGGSGIRLVVALLVLAGMSVLSAAPVKVIFDTDMGNDIDDALALAMLHGMATRGECEIVAVTVSKDHPNAALFVDVMNRFYRRPEIPVGLVRQGVTKESGPLLEVPLQRKDATGKPIYARRSSGQPFADAVAVLERVLQQQPEQSVVFVQVGFSTNLARLLGRPGGKALIARKVKFLSIMAGQFDRPGAEYNVQQDIASAQTLFSQWPTKIYVSPFELGDAILFPGASIAKDFNYVAAHPVADSYRAFQKFPYDRQTWDLTSTLFAVRPEANYFLRQGPGKIGVDKAGQTRFAPDPMGQHFVLQSTPEQRSKMLAAFVALAALAPSK